MHDLVISNAIIVDGTGREPVKGDLAVARGRISAIGTDLGPAESRIDAGGKVLMPGIIDTHTHYDAQITWDPWCDPSPALGVTTVVMGNCGFTIAPCKPGDRRQMMLNLSRVEGMSFDALDAGIRWEFEDFSGYLDMLQRQGVGPNVCAYIGHSALRSYVMGEAAVARAATDEEISSMSRLIADAMRAGAVGFSTSTHEQHVGDGGAAMPSRLADTRELKRLARAMGEQGRGVMMIVKGSKTSISDIEELAVEGGRPVFVSSMRHNPAQPMGVFNDLAMMRQARDRGNRLYGQCSCLPMVMDFTLEAPYIFEAFDAWRPALLAQEQSAQAYGRVLADAAFRGPLRFALRASGEQRLFKGDWSKLMVAETCRAENRCYEGRSVQELAAEQGQDPLDFFLDLALAEDLKTRFVIEVLNSDERAVARILSDPDSHVTLSDAGAHVTFICEAGFGLHLLGHWVRDLQVISLPEAVRRLTSQPANLLGLRDRGILAPGKAADLLWVDPDAVGIGERARLHDFPSGATRLRTSARGVHGVWINGCRVADADGLLGADKKPGQVLRDFAG
ncbi:MAG: amidohydrolase family protein [Burkholderiaceae bacterium]